MTKQENNIEILRAEIKRLRKFEPKIVSQRRSSQGLNRKVNKALEELLKN